MSPDRFALSTWEIVVVWTDHFAQAFFRDYIRNCAS